MPQKLPKNEDHESGRLAKIHSASRLIRQEIDDFRNEKEERVGNRKINLSLHKKLFGQFAERASDWAGTPIAFILSLLFVLAWAVAGPVFRYSTHWESLITEIPAVFTFFLVFLIQNSQGREMKAVQLKLNELIRATDGAHVMMLNLERLTEEELALLCDQYEILAQEARKRMKRGESDEQVVPMPIEAIKEAVAVVAEEVEEIEEKIAATPQTA